MSLSYYYYSSELFPFLDNGKFIIIEGEKKGWVTKENFPPPEKNRERIWYDAIGHLL